MTRHARPGRPTLFDDAARQRYLTARAVPGTTQAAAAAVAGVAARTVRLARTTDPVFAAADQQAAATARAESLAHGESRYNHRGCRCTICTKEATSARTERRENDQPGAPVTPISPPTEGSSRSFPLAAAS